MPRDPESIERGRRLFARECRFLTAATTPAALPDSDLPEVAFAGRSNVGKSSLMNALTGRRSLARVSRTPGRTRQINFFVLGDALMLADLPGYGFAKAGKREIAEWNRMTAAYLRGRAQLRRLCLLIDARLGPGEADRVVMGQLDRAAVSYQLVLTKCDKVTRDALESQCARVAGDIKTHAAAYPELIATSAVKRYGIAELRAALAELAR